MRSTSPRRMTALQPRPAGMISDRTVSPADPVIATSSNIRHGATVGCRTAELNMVCRQAAGVASRRRRVYSRAQAPQRRTEQRGAMMSEQPPLHRARKSIGLGLSDNVAQPEMARLRAYRMGRLQAELRRRDYGGALLYDPVNIRYATGSRNMAVWTLHNPARYAFVPAEGKAVIFDFHNCEHLSAGLETVGEIRPARAWYFFSAGSRGDEVARRWAAEIIELVRERCGANRRLAVDRLDFLGVRLLEAAGLE